MTTPTTSETIAVLRAETRRVAAHALVPYSGRQEAAVLLLADGTWVPGVRVESASFSLLIPALLNAFTTAVAVERTDVVAVVLDHPFLPEEVAFLQATPPGTFIREADDVFVANGVEALPALTAPINPFLPPPIPHDPVEGIALARKVAARAHVPESRFPVGCVLVMGEGPLVPGVNVEHADWSRILCAERNALGTAITWGLHDVDTMYLTCLKDAGATPCGACRQLLAELAPTAMLWMDRGIAAPEKTTPEHLLPGAFNGKALTSPA